MCHASCNRRACSMVSPRRPARISEARERDPSNRARSPCPACSIRARMAAPASGGSIGQCLRSYSAMSAASTSNRSARGGPGIGSRLNTVQSPIAPNRASVRTGRISIGITPSPARSCRIRRACRRISPTPACTYRKHGRPAGNGCRRHPRSDGCRLQNPPSHSVAPNSALT
jgi:hypothetical protein